MTMHHVSLTTRHTKNSMRRSTQGHSADSQAVIHAQL